MSYGNYLDSKKISRVLIIKLRNLGDVLLTTPLYKAMKRVWPDVTIDAYIYKSSLEILDQNPYLSEILTFEEGIKKMFFPKRFWEEGKILRKIRSKNYDLVLNLTEGDRGALVAKHSKAQYRVGCDEGASWKKKIYTHLVKNSGSPRHTVEKNLDFIRRIGINPIEEDKDLFFLIGNGEHEKMEKILKDVGVERKKFILIHPSSRWRFKCWPTFRMKNLIKYLLSTEMKIVLSASNDPFEKSMVDEICDGFVKDRVLNLAGSTSLKELGALIEMSKLLLCMDSVPLHIASALKAKCLVLFGPTQDKVWGPWKNENAHVIFENFSCRPCCLDGCGGSKMSDCLFSISEERVFQKVRELIV